tara:strand:+ start:10435 stop:10806 length:372 start_codon:yes stop_codon:yes gene_type:complete
MIQKYLLYILITLTFIQSTDAIADAAKFHQPNSEYTEADYFPSYSPNYFSGTVFKSASSDINTNDPKQNNDADHCCSCHGITTALLLSNELFFKAGVLPNEIAEFSNRYLSKLITPDIRPPIV